jgi:hypothetical protein
MRYSALQTWHYSNLLPTSNTIINLEYVYTNNVSKSVLFNTPVQSVSFLFRLTVLSTLVLSNASDLSQLANTEARIILLYSTREEARQILAEATRLKLTGK